MEMFALWTKRRSGETCLRAAAEGGRTLDGRMRETPAVRAALREETPGRISPTIAGHITKRSGRQVRRQRHGRRERYRGRTHMSSEMSELTKAMASVVAPLTD